jgi:hypothetical protein
MAKKGRPSKNPKLIDTMIEDVIPQSGSCPLKCLECFYNAPGFYRPKKCKLPDPEKINKAGKIVRVN